MLNSILSFMQRNAIKLIELLIFKFCLLYILFYTVSQIFEYSDTRTSEINFNFENSNRQYLQSR